MGSGLTSDAYVGIDKENKELVCVKVVDRETFKDQNQRQLLDNEIKCQQKLNSDFIIHVNILFYVDIQGVKKDFNTQIIMDGIEVSYEELSGGQKNFGEHSYGIGYEFYDS